MVKYLLTAAAVNLSPELIRLYFNQAYKLQDIIGGSRKNSTDTTKTKAPATKEEVKEEVKKQAEDKVKGAVRDLFNRNKKENR